MDGSRKALALGPYMSHQDALEAVDAVREYVNNHDFKAAFYAYGTCGMDVSGDFIPPAGKLNVQLELETPATMYAFLDGIEGGLRHLREQRGQQ